jgi:predicted nucleic acid-binding Zn ribbon protein|tara:strand:+ start:66 stop:365 length:300 start_codon:yes stop_codon:yes gene_type:complete
MPTYTFENTKTGKVFDEYMSISDRETYLEQNPHIKQLINKINIVSGTGGIKNDSGWNDNLQRIAEAHPTSPLADRYGKKSIKEIKTKQVVEKHRKRKGK